MIFTDFPIERISDTELRRRAGTAISILYPDEIEAPALNSSSQISADLNINAFYHCSVDDLSEARFLVLVLIKNSLYGSYSSPFCIQTPSMVS